MEDLVALAEGASDGVPVALDIGAVGMELRV